MDDLMSRKKAENIFNKLLEEYKEGKKYSSDIPLGTIFGLIVEQDNEVNFTKPILVLIDESCYSTGDMFPALIKNNSWNGRIVLYGNTTGGAGGNVNNFIKLLSKPASCKFRNTLNRSDFIFEFLRNLLKLSSNYLLNTKSFKFIDPFIKVRYRSDFSS